MKPYSIETSEKIVKAYQQGDTSILKVAARFDVSKAFVQKLLKQKPMTGHVQPKKQGGSLKSVLHWRTTQLTEMVEKYPDSIMNQNIVNMGSRRTSTLSAKRMMCPSR